MKLTELFSLLNMNVRVDKDPEILGVSDNSRTLRQGEVFFDGTENPSFISAAKKRGALATVTSDISLASLSENIFTHPQPNIAYAQSIAALYPHTIPTLFGVTGTNGKSSTVDFMRQILTSLGEKSASMGTLGCLVGAGVHLDVKMPSLTTPDAKNLHKALQQLGKCDVKNVAIEATSIGMDQGRLHGIKFSHAGFTNFTQDHLDYHKNMDNYFECKTKLFSELLKKGGTAVIHQNNVFGERLIALCESLHIPVLSYSVAEGGADLSAALLQRYAKGMKLKLTHRQEQNIESITVDVAVLGDFQMENILCAVGLILAEKKCTLLDLKNAIESLKAPVGRMEHIATTDFGADIFLDYAHTPDALKRALDALQAHTKKRVYVVFGCGGNRDKEKRPLMGQISKKHAHFSIITDDNPRDEDADEIRSAIRKNHPLALDVPNRAHAIAKAITLLEAGDSLLIAGKGHETTQTVKNKSFPFSDRLVVLECLQRKAV